MKSRFLTILLLLTTFTAFCAPAIYSGESLVSEIFMKRHSGKSYDPTRNLSQDQLRALVDAARWAPSSHNDQPWNFIFCDREATPEAFNMALSSLKGTQQLWAKNAQIIVIIAARSKTLYKDKPNDWAEYDTGAAALSMALQAADLGLMAHQIGGFDDEIIEQAFTFPANVKPVTLMIIGYETSDQDQDPGAKPRERRSSSENFFLGEWGKPLLTNQKDIETINKTNVY
ncbi:MAG: nitroreductase family protein [Parachlamydia sp.]|nr:nitroreductase family protein [Parachlamydia sp.]